MSLRWCSLFIWGTGLALAPLSALVSSEGHKPAVSVSPVSACPHVAACGGALTGTLVEGRVGSTPRERRRRFYCYSATAPEGFLGPHSVAKRISLRDQPGVFPAPIVGQAALSFTFYCRPSSAPSVPGCAAGGGLTPVVVRPDGTVLKGGPMAPSDCPQTILIPAPAQAGIYDVFALTGDSAWQEVEIEVAAAVSTHPHHQQMLKLKPYGSGCTPLLSNAEFLYLGR